MLDQSIQHDLLATRTRWVNNKPIDLGRESGQDILDFTFENLYVVNITRIPLCVFDGARRLFNGDDFADMTCKQEGECPDSTVGVNDGKGWIGRREQSVEYYLCHFFGLGCVGLEKRAGTNAKGCASKCF